MCLWIGSGETRKKNKDLGNISPAFKMKEKLSVAKLKTVKIDVEGYLWE